jgi:hypothetical protein
MNAISADDPAADQYLIQIGVNRSHKAKTTQPMVRSVTTRENADATTQVRTSHATDWKRHFWATGSIVGKGT